ncbi:MAG: ferredoxin-like protein [Youngiibacter sp.]|jgi:Fe-S-cluster-containing dehydrogenase component|nr:ferredoxin-like protein [Youngiibacter sp.]
MEEKKSFFNKEQTRRDFLKLTGKGIGGAVVSLSILSLFGCDTKEVSAFPIAEGLLVADRSKCTGCQRCEITCTAMNEGKIQPFISRINVSKNYNFGKEGPKINFASADGQYGNLLMSPSTCKQCREPFCGNACPVGAIFADKNNGNARTVNKELCIGCGTCVQACPWHMPNVDAETKKSSKCITCGECAKACPTGALSVIPWEDIKVAMDRHGMLLG